MVIVAIVGLALAHTVFALPAVPTARPINEAKARSLDTSVLHYLEQYGYMKKEPNAMRTEHAVREGLKRFQRFAGLRPTGIVDERTAQLLVAKRCGMPDMDPEEKQPKRRRRRYAVSNIVWPDKDITWSIHRYPSNSEHLTHEKVRRVMNEAFRVWADASALTFNEVSTRAEARTQVDFYRYEHGDGNDFDGRGKVLAHAFYPGSGHGGDVHFDDDEAWTDRHITNPWSNETNLYSVAAHEIGHSLGLEHSDDEGALMFPFYNYTTSQRMSILNRDDVLAIQELYGCPSTGCEVLPNEPPSTKSPPHPTPSIPPTTTPPVWTGDENTGGPVLPNMCNGHIDAISQIRNEIFVFKGDYFWRLDNWGNVISRPTRINTFWPGLPANLSRIDAVYERFWENTIVFFVDRSYYVYTITSQGVQLRPGYPRSIDSLNEHVTPAALRLNRVVAAFVWNYNGATYMFDERKRFWRFHENDSVVEASAYPRDVGRHYWPDVHIDAAFSNLTEDASITSTYFFSGDHVYAWDSYRSQLVDGYPVAYVDFWRHCQMSSEAQKLHAPPTTQGVGALRLSSLLSLIVCFALLLQ